MLTRALPLWWSEVHCCLQYTWPGEDCAISSRATRVIFPRASWANKGSECVTNLHVLTSSYLHFFSSSHLHLHICTCHLHNYLHILVSSQFLTSAHLHIPTLSAHLYKSSLSFFLLHIFTSSRLRIFSVSLSLSLSCPLSRSGCKSFCVRKKLLRVKASVEQWMSAKKCKRVYVDKVSTCGSVCV